MLCVGEKIETTTHQGFRSSRNVFIFPGIHREAEEVEIEGLDDVMSPLFMIYVEVVEYEDLTFPFTFVMSFICLVASSLQSRGFHRGWFPYSWSPCPRDPGGAIANRECVCSANTEEQQKG